MGEGLAPDAHHAALQPGRSTTSGCATSAASSTCGSRASSACASRLISDQRGRAAGGDVEGRADARARPPERRGTQGSRLGAHAGLGARVARRAVPAEAARRGSQGRGRRFARARGVAANREAAARRHEVPRARHRRAQRLRRDAMLGLAVGASARRRRRTSRPSRRRSIRAAWRCSTCSTPARTARWAMSPGWSRRARPAGCRCSSTRACCRRRSRRLPTSCCPARRGSRRTRPTRTTRASCRRPRRPSTRRVNAVEDWQILTSVAAALGLPYTYTSSQQVRADVAAALPGRPGIRRPGRQVFNRAGRRRALAARPATRWSAGSGTHVPGPAAREGAQRPDGAGGRADRDSAAPGNRRDLARIGVAVAGCDANLDRPRGHRSRGGPAGRRSVGAGSSQHRPGVAELAVTPAALEVQPGGSARAAITVPLPEGFHMNSDKPRDENLIPITVSMEAVPAVIGAMAAFPEASDFKQEGEPVPLRVFEREFAIGVQFTVAADAAAGAHRDAVARSVSGLRREAVLPADHGATRNETCRYRRTPPWLRRRRRLAKLDFAKAAAVPIVAPRPLTPAAPAPATPD